jgi:VIT1/CCC1 family predicted Fe2+/Mn2+ transporter
MIDECDRHVYATLLYYEAVCSVRSAARGESVTMESSWVGLAKDFYLDEINDYLTYKAMATHARDENIRRNIARIAEMEKWHAGFWQEILAAHNQPLPQGGINRARLCWLNLLRVFINPVLILSLLELGEASAMRHYLDFYRHAPLSETEKARLKRIILDELEHETFFKQTAKALGVSNLRDFVLGMNDGLVEILGAVTGLSAVYPDNPLLVAVSGLIVGIAGALSMGIGAFISVRSQRQVNESVRERLEVLFAIDPERAVHAYRGELVESGVPAALAEEVARTLGKNKRALANLVLPTSQDDNELRSAMFTGGAYLIGVLFPVLPYFMAPSSFIALPLSVVLAGLSLTIVATIVAMLSGISMRRKIVEMVVSGFAAAGLSYAFGTLMRSVFGLGGDL